MHQVDLLVLTLLVVPAAAEVCVRLKPLWSCLVKTLTLQP